MKSMAANSGHQPTDSAGFPHRQTGEMRHSVLVLRALLQVLLPPRGASWNAFTDTLSFLVCDVSTSCRAAHLSPEGPSHWLSGASGAGVQRRHYDVSLAPFSVKEKHVRLGIVGRILVNQRSFCFFLKSCSLSCTCLHRFSLRDGDLVGRYPSVSFMVSSLSVTWSASELEVLGELFVCGVIGI